VRGWQHAAAGEWSELAALDGALAAAETRDPSRRDGLRLRIEWRIAAPDAAASPDEAIALATELLSHSEGAPDILLAARAYAAAGQPAGAFDLVDYLSRSRRRRVEQQGAVVLLEELRPNVDPEEWAAVRRRFNPRRR